MKIYCLLFFTLLCTILFAEDGYEAWMRNKPITNQAVLSTYQKQIKQIALNEIDASILIAGSELTNALNSLLAQKIEISPNVEEASIVLGSGNSEIIKSLKLPLDKTGDEGYIIKTLEHNGKSIIAIVANKPIGVLYGTYHFIRLIQTEKPIDKLDILETPKIQHRLLNHWDNLDGHVERGYAGQSLWRWHELPEVVSPRYEDYARYNASIGINGTALTNVNSNANILTPEYLEKVKVLADIFRPYGIKVYLTARFNAPMELDGYNTADPLNEKVIAWWEAKVKEIYAYVPDFGGFLVKANSEGQPGPREYGRSHAEGANLLARALKPHGGIVMWRAFVYSNEEPDDRAKQAFNEFMPLDDKFEENVLVQTKNGPIDFQPREPFHPLFGAMKQTPLMMEFQITQEYLGQGLHLCYLAPLYKECLDSDTYAKGKGSTVAKAIDGNLHGNKLTGMAGVSNIGSDRNWTGHPFGQANWYAYGRLAWNHELSSEEIAEEWIKMTYGKDPKLVKDIKEIMMISREAEVKSKTPLGLHHQMAWHHHYGPGPWIKDKPRADWTSHYYHRANEKGIGFDRTETGSNAVSQYFPEVRDVFVNLETCPEEYLLWFHHVSWDYTMKSGHTLWEELCYQYDEGIRDIKQMQKTWDSLEDKVDQEQFIHVQSLLEKQLKTAYLWRGSCILYYQTYSKKPLPEWFEKPEKTLEEYKKVEFKYLPGS